MVSLTRKPSEIDEVKWLNEIKEGWKSCPEDMRLWYVLNSLRSHLCDLKSFAKALNTQSHYPHTYGVRQASEKQEKGLNHIIERIAKLFDIELDQLGTSQDIYEGMVMW